MLGAKLLSNDARERQFVVERRARAALEADRIRLHRPARVLAHERDNRARIDATAQERADRHIAHHLVAHGAFHLGANLLAPALRSGPRIHAGFELPEAVLAAPAVFD